MFSLTLLTLDLSLALLGATINKLRELIDALVLQMCLGPTVAAGTSKVPSPGKQLAPPARRRGTRPTPR